MRTPNFDYNIPVAGSSGWGEAQNSNWLSIDGHLQPALKKHLHFEITPTLSSYYLLGSVGATESTSVSALTSPVTVAGGYGQGRLKIETTGGADTTGTLTVTGTSRTYGVGISRTGVEENLAFTGLASKLTTKSWRHTGADNLLELSTADLDADLDLTIVRYFDNDIRPFAVEYIEYSAVATGVNTGITFELIKMVTDPAFSETELLAGRLDITEASREAGTYTDKLSLGTAIDPCEGEGLLLAVTFDNPAHWSWVRVIVEIAESVS